MSIRWPFAIAVLSLLSLAFVSADSNAQEVTFSTEVLSANGPHAAEFPPGTPATISYFLDSSVTDTDPDPSAGFYANATLSLVFTFPTFTFEFSQGTVQTFDNTANPDDQVSIRANVNQNNAMLGGEAVLGAEFGFIGTTDMLASDALPLSVLENVTNAGAFLHTAGGVTQITFLPTADTVVIPLSSSLQVAVRADADGNTGPDPEVLQTDLQTQGSTLDPLSVTAEAESMASGARVNSVASADLVWNDAASGVVTIDHTLQLGPGTVAGSTGGISGVNFTPGTFFFYAFQTTGDRQLSVDFDFGNGFCCSFQYRIDGSFGAFSGSDPTGSLTFDLIGAGFHSITLGPTSLSAVDTIGGPNREFTQTYDLTLTWRLARISSDTDGDGIEDAIDVEVINTSFVDRSEEFSNPFTDQHLGGFTFGSIVDRNADIITIVDDHLLGVVISGNGGTDGQPQRVEACSNPVINIFLTDGDQITVTCGSFTGEVLAGPVLVNVAMNINVTIPTGATAFVEELPGSILSISNLGETGGPSLVIDDNGILTSLGPDDSPFVTILDDDDDDSDTDSDSDSDSDSEDDDSDSDSDSDSD